MSSRIEKKDLSIININNKEYTLIFHNSKWKYKTPDLRGKQFGRLTVLDLVKKDDTMSMPGYYWLCKCECGNFSIVNTGPLKYGNTTSCGCKRIENTSKSNTHNILGQKFGKLTVLEQVKSNNGHAMWKCKCDCGGEKVVSGKNLIRGDTLSCGCLHSKGEHKIIELLTKFNVKYQQEYIFNDLISPRNNKLRFDFAIFYEEKLSHLIEFQGKQHYYNNFHLTEEEFNYRLKLDQMKRDYCKEHNIPLIEIKYNQDFNIEDLLLYRTKAIKDEVFQDYKKSSMLISNTTCNFKCDKINGCKVCQNSELVKGKTFILSFKDIIERYKNNPITSAVIFGGLEQFDEFSQMSLLINVLRNRYNILDDIIIYTGYTKEQVINQINYLQKFKNIIIKFNPYLMNRKKRFDELLGVTLSSDNQYSERIS